MPSWPLLPLKSRAVFSSGCSTEQTVGRSHRERGAGRREVVVEGRLMEKSRNKVLAANSPREGRVWAVGGLLTSPMGPVERREYGRSFTLGLLERVPLQRPLWVEGRGHSRTCVPGAAV